MRRRPRKHTPAAPCDAGCGGMVGGPATSCALTVSIRVCQRCAKALATGEADLSVHITYVPAQETPMDEKDLMAMPCLYMDDEHLKKIGAREPVFVIRAQDLTGPDAVEAWCKLAEAAGAPAEKVAHARLHAEAMRRWAGAKKVPD